MNGKSALAVVLAPLLVVTGSRAFTQSPVGVLTDKEVSQAIDRAAKQQVTSVCVGKPVPGEFTVCLQGPEQRIWAAALLAKQAQRKLRPADIASDLKSRTWLVVVRPNRPGLVEGQPTRTPSPEEVSLSLVGQSQRGSIKPLSVSRVAFEWDNARGVTLKGEGLSATFDPAPLPLGDIEILISIEGSSERRYILSDAERSQVR